jgi:hypothetical protein
VGAIRQCRFAMHPQLHDRKRNGKSFDLPSLSMTGRSCFESDIEPRVSSVHCLVRPCRFSCLEPTEKRTLAVAGIEPAGQPCNPSFWNHERIVEDSKGLDSRLSHHTIVSLEATRELSILEFIQVWMIKLVKNTTNPPFIYTPNGVPRA